MKNENIKTLKYFLKDDIRQETDFKRTDQNMGVPAPPIEKPCPLDAKKIPLIEPEAVKIGEVSLKTAILRRESRRRFSNEALSIDELSFLLWATQGVRKWQQKNALRTVPSAGNRHALETYLAVFNVDGLETGIYRYLPSQHQLVLELSPDHLKERMTEAALNQKFAGSSAVTFIWTTISYRMEWRYAEASYKVIALDAGHICQNLYLACEAIGAGTCAIAAYDQQAADRLLSIDGEDEFVVYMAPIGKV
ncbi:SagB/ThcOx family dehydrogenase [Acetobacterium sp. K1/6]|jgi:SagB-type dehydrogenase family enzyme|uniref:SagB/ThcOx family dehydrogenase n=1 Tax=Acetobacterium sp. K1/6 TaxID=3055467 RepID=UPI002ACA04B9|nr:SagB/ThcOx family dehydrogenase [Acetobacterium sp. K1/6]MDZ5724492.1 SagB/ThcOx family dehydrogenase [Acetobacterium sp. K1/6]